ncbi:ABC1 kinase family protein [Bacillus suaedae]|uniref:AarF/ABC1/UbiB kinase family protein n=1 Tax=Halalkalibacter suaedae TaxID=2822140 RepID=A0A940WSF3_9BACI|nr:AarF/UbiB family protein [Bacillus suaedae]MBP3951874.1 AarF/ABC1/UbiB kinase family protein [Bacillus suaedae]
MKNIAIYRIIVIVNMAVKFFIQIILFQKRYQHNWSSDQAQRKWEALLKKQAAEYRETAIKLEGLLIKLGQFLSSRADIMPQVFLNELEELVDRVPAVFWEKAKKVLEDEWNGDYGAILHKVSVEPVASASIGEVYHGYLHNGDSVAIKIQRPGIDKIIRTDFKAMRIVMWLAKTFTSYGKRMDLSKLYKEMTIVIGDELNFIKELKNATYFQNRYLDSAEMKIPSYYQEYSTRKVLVMEWIEGTRITDLSFLEKNGINRDELAERLFKAFLEQILQEGRFHADPHPGNIMVQSDGTIVLLDFGMVGTIQKNDAVAIRRLVEGILFDDYDKVIEALEALRFLLPHANKEKLKDVIRTLINTYVERDFTQMDDYLVQQILDDIQTVIKEEPIQLPSELAFFGRAISTFVGILYILNPKINILEISKPLIMEWLRDFKEDGRSSAVGLIQQYLKPLLGVPRKLDDVLNEPKRFRQLQEEKEQLRLRESFYRSVKRDTFVFMILSLIGSYIGVILDQTELIYGSVATFVISTLFYLRSLLSYRRLVKRSFKNESKG